MEPDGRYPSYPVNTGTDFLLRARSSDGPVHPIDTASSAYFQDLPFGTRFP